MKTTGAILLSILLPSLQAHAADFRSGERVVISRDTAIDDDLYVSADTVEIDGTIHGDVVAVGKEVIVTGDVQGALIAAGSRVRVDGHIARAARIAGEDVQFGPQSRVERDAIAAGQSVMLAGWLARDAVFAGGQVHLVGQVGGKSIAAADQLWVADSASIRDLEYYSPNIATIGSTAKIGAVDRHAIEKRPQSVFAIGWVAAAITAFILGALLLRLGGSTARVPVSQVRARPGASFGYGALLLTTVPPLALLTMVTLIGLPIGIFGFLLLGTASYFGYLVTALAIGDWTLTRLRKGSAASPYASLAFGLLMLAVLGRVPVLGGLLAFAAVLVGLGALWVTVLGSKWYDRTFRHRRSASQPPMVTPRTA